jgi:hypothetical protein
MRQRKQERRKEKNSGEKNEKGIPIIIETYSIHSKHLTQDFLKRKINKLERELRDEF